MFRLVVAGVWSVSWAALGYWQFDPETHIARGPTFRYVGNDPAGIEADRRREIESTLTGVAVGAVIGGLGGLIVAPAARSRPWWFLVAAIAVGALVGGTSQTLHEWRYPIYAGPVEQWQSPWKGAAAFALSGAALGALAGVLLMAVGEGVNRLMRKSRPHDPAVPGRG
jgi:hypothetical protein